MKKDLTAKYKDVEDLTEEMIADIFADDEEEVDEEIEELYAASRMTEEDTAELLNMNPDDIDLSDDDMAWLDTKGKEEE